MILAEQGPDVPPGTFKDFPSILVAELRRVAETDEDGRYAFRVGPGTHVLRGPQVASEPSPQHYLEVKAGQDIEQDFSLPRADRPWGPSAASCGPGNPTGRRLPARS